MRQEKNKETLITVATISQQHQGPIINSDEYVGCYRLCFTKGHQKENFLVFPSEVKLTLLQQCKNNKSNIPYNRKNRHLVEAGQNLVARSILLTIFQHHQQSTEALFILVPFTR